MSSVKLKIINKLSLLRKKILGIDPRSQLEIAVANGLKLGKNCHIMGEVIIDPGHCWLIEISDNVTIAPRCHILAHDASTKRDLGYAVIGRVFIGSNTFIGAGTIVLPGVRIGRNCVIGAGGVVKNDIPDNCVAVGNPAKVICTKEEYLSKRKKQMAVSPVYSKEYIIGSISEEMKAEMQSSLVSGIGFVE